MYEWALDWYSTSWYTGAGNFCNNCANLTNASYRVIRGGSFGYVSHTVRAAYRYGSSPAERTIHNGFRCARSAS
jgi:formylglycine-generating enzyme required for sulfatase activity